MVEKKAGSGAPSRIIFYRNGVSEGQFKQVLDVGMYALVQYMTPVLTLSFFRTEGTEACLCRLENFTEDHRHCRQKTPPCQVFPSERR